VEYMPARALSRLKDETAEIVASLVRVGAYSLAKSFISFIEKREREKEVALRRARAELMRGLDSDWRCQHWHTKESHPECYKRYLVRTRIKSLKEIK
jgi:hypothetical protein